MKNNTRGRKTLIALEEQVQDAQYLRERKEYWKRLSKRMKRLFIETGRMKRFDFVIKNDENV